MGVKIVGLERARLIPKEIEERLLHFRQALVRPLVTDFIAHEPPPSTTWPKKRRKHIQEQTKGFVRGPVVIISTFGSRYAKALDKGLVVRPRKRKVMRFLGTQGNFVFSRKPIVHPPRPFYGAVLARVPEIVKSVYERVFSGVGDA